MRVVTIPDASTPRGFYSKELCGGTHVVRTGDIGVFKIIGEQSVAAGVRRIEAISGDRALAEYQQPLTTLRTVAGLLNAGEDEVIARAGAAIRSHQAAGKAAGSAKTQSGRLAGAAIWWKKRGGEGRSLYRGPGEWI